MREEDLYELAKDELNSRNRKADLWARACALATDDVDEARYLYTNLRVEELAVEHNIDLTLANQIPPQELSSLALADIDTPDNTTSLPHGHAETLSQRIPDSDDESNLTPAQLALKRVSEGMGEDNSPGAGELQQSAVASPETADNSLEGIALKAGGQMAADDDHPDLSIDNSFLSQTSADSEAAPANAEVDAAKSTGSHSGSASMVLGDLTTDSDNEADNTIHIDAEAPLSNDSLSLTDLQADLQTNLQTDPQTDVQKNPGTENTGEQSTHATVDESTTMANADNPSTNTDNLQTQIPNSVDADDKKPEGASIADESLNALMSDFIPQPVAAPSTAGMISNSTNTEAKDASASSDNTLNESNSINSVETDNDEFKLPEQPTQATSGNSKAGTGLIGNPAETDTEEDADDLHELIGYGEEEIEANAESADTADESQAGDIAQNEFNNNDSSTIAAMQDAGPQLAREYAIYQNASGIVSAVPRGGNLKAMFFTLPWLLSRRLWGHSVVYLLLLAVLVTAVLTTASLVYGQWPDVKTLDLAVAGFFAVLAVIGLFLLPYKFANQWQEDKIAKQGFKYKNDQLASSLAGAEQSFLLDPRNRRDHIETDNDYRQAA